MILDTIDWTIIVGFMVVTLVIGLAVTKRARRSSADFFLGPILVAFCSIVVFPDLESC